jgi:outer membrane protein assembly factor BamA
MRHWPLVIAVGIFLAVTPLMFGEVHQGSKKVNAVEFSGNSTFSVETLQNQLRQLKPGEWTISCGTESDIATTLNAFLRENGFMRGQVTVQELPVSNDTVDLRIVVSEGPQYRLSSFSFSGMKFFNRERTASLFDVSPGDVVNFKKVKEGLDQLKSLYSNYGFINWSYVPEQAFDEENKTMQLSFTINEGMQHVIAYLAFAGCRDRAEEDRLRAEVVEQPGQVFSPPTFQIDALRLRQRHGLVKESMEIIDAEKGLVGLVFWLKPRSSN